MIMSIADVRAAIALRVPPGCDPAMWAAAAHEATVSHHPTEWYVPCSHSERHNADGTKPSGHVELEGTDDIACADSFQGIVCAGCTEKAPSGQRPVWWDSRAHRRLHVHAAAIEVGVEAFNAAPSPIVVARALRAAIQAALDHAEAAR